MTRQSQGGTKMAKRTVATGEAPAAIGPYSQAVGAGPFIFTSGQIPIDPETGQVVEGDIAAQTRRVLENLRGVLTAAGVTLGDVVKTTVFVRNLGQMPMVNEIYAEYFDKDPPARSTVAVDQLPMDVAIEIEMIALANNGRQRLTSLE